MTIESSVPESGNWNRDYLLKLGKNRPELLLFYGHKVTDPVTETCLSQWYPCQFEVDDITYTSAEQYMMAEKAKLFGDEEIRTEILNTSDPQKCKVLGRKVKYFDKDIWNQNKIRIVTQGNKEKFMQNDTLKEFLLSTGDKVLVEASPTDRIWGIGLGKNNPDVLNPAKWRGRNLLGFSLMDVRAFIVLTEVSEKFDKNKKENN